MAADDDEEDLDTDININNAMQAIGAGLSSEGTMHVLIDATASANSRHILSAHPQTLPRNTLYDTHTLLHIFSKHTLTHPYQCITF